MHIIINASCALYADLFMLFSSQIFPLSHFLLFVKNIDVFTLDHSVSDPNCIAMTNDSELIFPKKKK